MRGILKIAGLISLLIIILNFSIQGLVNLKTAVMLLFFGIILQTVSDSLFRISLTVVSLAFFLWTLTNGSFSGVSQILNGIFTLVVMMTGVSVMFKGLFRSR
jgi:hypothetical protein